MWSAEEKGEAETLCGFVGVLENPVRGVVSFQTYLQARR